MTSLSRTEPFRRAPSPHPHRIGRPPLDRPAGELPRLFEDQPGDQAGPGTEKQPDRPVHDLGFSWWSCSPPVDHHGENLERRPGRHEPGHRQDPAPGRVPDGRADQRQRRRGTAPLRMVLGSQALKSTIAVLRMRIDDFETQTALAASTNYPTGK
jgi:hypothetical protein